MNPRFVFRKGIWYCAGDSALGSGHSIAEAWDSWSRDWTSWSRIYGRSDDYA